MPLNKLIDIYIYILYIEWPGLSKRLHSTKDSMADLSRQLQDVTAQYQEIQKGTLKLKSKSKAAPYLDRMLTSKTQILRMLLRRDRS